MRESGHEALIVGGSDASGDSVFPLFDKDAFSQPFRLSAATLAMKYLRSVQHIVETNEITHVFSYDGEINILRLCLKLAKNNPELTVIFNLQQAADIAHLSQSRSFWARYFFSLLGELPPNVTLACESLKLSDHLLKNKNLAVAPIPVPTAFGEISQRLSEKDIDVLFCPRNEFEFEWCSQVACDVRRLRGDSTCFGWQIRYGAADLTSLTQGDKVFDYPLDDRGHLSMHLRARIVCLPYLDKDFHVWGSSGRYQDALLAMAVPLSPPSTSMNYDTASRDARLLPEDDSPKAMAEVIVVALNEEIKPWKPLQISELATFISSAKNTSTANFKIGGRVTFLGTVACLMLLPTRKVTFLELTIHDLKMSVRRAVRALTRVAYRGSGN